MASPGSLILIQFRGCISTALTLRERRAATTRRRHYSAAELLAMSHHSELLLSGPLGRESPPMNVRF